MENHPRNVKHNLRMIYFRCNVRFSLPESLEKETVTSLQVHSALPWDLCIFLLWFDIFEEPPKRLNLHGKA